MMPPSRGGFLIRFDEEQRTTFLKAISSLDQGFSDALSSEDWPVRYWEVCGLLFEPKVITHWALARRGNRVATGKVRVDFIEVVPTHISVTAIEERVGTHISANIVRTRSGVGGPLAPDTWGAMKAAVGEINASSLAQLERLERLADQSRERIERPGTEVVAQQRDAVGCALDVFDETGQLRRRTLKSWAAPAGDRLTSFLDGLPRVRIIEDQLVAHDAAVFPEASSRRPTVVGSVFSLGDRQLEVFNVNRTAVEKCLGVDLVYYHEEFEAWTVVQYKVMEQGPDDSDRSAIYRPDDLFYEELRRMQAFHDAHPNHGQLREGPSGYRLGSDGFFFKLCSRIQLEVLSQSLLPGMYLPRQFVETLLLDGQRGARGAIILSHDSTRRHLSNTLFASLLRDGWLGTRGLSSERMANIIHDGLSYRRSVVLARGRPAHAPADPRETLCMLGLETADLNN